MHQPRGLHTDKSEYLDDNFNTLPYPRCQVKTQARSPNWNKRSVLKEKKKKHTTKHEATHTDSELKKEENNPALT